MKPRTFKQRTNQINSFLQDWREGSIVHALQDLAENKKYFSWADPFARSADDYFSSRNWKEAFQKVDAASKEIQVGLFSAHQRYLQQCILEDVGQMDLSGKLEIVVHESLPAYKTVRQGKIIPPSAFAEGYYSVGELSLQEKHFSAEENTALATLITFLLPIRPRVLRNFEVPIQSDLQISLLQKGCYVKLPQLLPNRHLLKKRR